jgi:hypothetical protein
MAISRRKKAKILIYFRLRRGRPDIYFELIGLNPASSGWLSRPPARFRASTGLSPGFEGGQKDIKDGPLVGRG